MDKETIGEKYPYNFVSLGDKVLNRGERVIGEKTGILKCKLITYSPLFIMGKREIKNDHSEEYFLEKNNEYLIPGSTLKGEIRTIIEVLTNSVIRNVEVKRLEKRLKPGNFKAKFGVIKKIPANEKEKGEIQIVKKIKIEKNLSYKLVKDRDLSKGGIVPLRFKKNVLNDYEENHKIETKEEFMKIYTSKKENSILGKLWVASDIITKKYEKIFLENEKGKIYEFSKQEYDDFKYIIDQRIKREDEEIYLKSYGLKKGEPIIFEVDEKEGKIIHLAFSEIPRLRYKFSPYDLIPSQFRQSNSLKELSFSEKLFGTTGNHHEEKKDKNLISITGRVYFTDAKLSKDKAKFVDKKPITLKPFGEPHPTLLGFYLQSDGSYDLKNSKIRGRKFYWHHKDKIQKKFDSFSKSIKMNSRERYNASLQLLDFGNEFEFEVYFKNLTDDELGVLIYSLKLEENLLHKIGKGKAFGFGSCKIEINEFLLENKNKYSSFTKNEIINEKKDINEYVKSAMKKGYIDEKRTNIKELKTILNKNNNLDFTKSPFPESKDKNGFNTLAWFNERKNKKLILDTILNIGKNK